MIKVRLIPVLLLKSWNLVRSQGFTKHNIIGDPFHEVERFNQWNVDELIYLIIDKLSDFEIKEKKPINLLKDISKTCFMPLTFGGQIRSIEDIYERFENGAYKITLNTVAFMKPDFVKEVSNIFGRQAIVASIDYKTDNHKTNVYVSGGETSTNIDVLDWALELEKLGAGEILLQSIDRDGQGKGYDLDLIDKIASKINIPIIPLGGVGQYEHYVEAIKAGASAVASANIWHFKEMADYWGKTILKNNNIPVRLDGI